MLILTGIACKGSKLKAVSKRRIALKLSNQMRRESSSDRKNYNRRDERCMENDAIVN